MHPKDAKSKGSTTECGRRSEMMLSVTSRKVSRPPDSSSLVLVWVEDLPVSVSLISKPQKLLRMLKSSLLDLQEWETKNGLNLLMDSFSILESTSEETPLPSCLSASLLSATTDTPDQPWSATTTRNSARPKDAKKDKTNLKKK